jgi:hypothetical protein
MLNVELIYDSDCPNVTGARENLARAFAKAGIAAKWKEWERSNPDAPGYARRFGSPAILVNGQDVGGMVGGLASACRLYWTSEGPSSGTPPVDLIAAALTVGSSGSSGSGLRRHKYHLAVVPAILLALLPNLTCPACWPAYAGSLSAFGLGFLARSEYLMPLTSAFLAIALAGLWHRAEARRGYLPFYLGFLASGTLLIGKFWIESDPLFYAGLFTLVGASLWNAWPRKLRIASGVESTVSRCKCSTVRKD